MNYNRVVNGLEPLKKQVPQVDSNEKAELRANAWDAQIEHDINAGKLDSLANAALERFTRRKTEKFTRERLVK
jgi:hypothetical protein